jgi:hypothetical protein
MFIGRADILKQIEQDVSDDKKVGDLWGDLGSGRSWLLNELCSKQTERGLSVLISLESFDPGHPGEVEEKASVGAVQANFNQFAALLRRLIERVGPPDVQSAMERAIQNARNDEVLAGRVISIDATLEEISPPFVPHDFAEAWRRAAEAVARAFVKLWAASDRTRLLMLDDFDRVADQEIGMWLKKLFSSPQTLKDAWGPLARTFVLLTRTSNVPRAVLPKADAVWPIGNFTLQEVSDYLTEVRNGASVGSDTLNKVYEITGGHPATLRLVHELVWGAKGRAKDPSAVLGQLTKHREEQVAKLVGDLVDRLEQPGLMTAIQAASVPRRFDAELLSALLRDSGDLEVAPQDVEPLFGAIRDDLPFTEEVPAPEDAVVLRIHEYVRQSVLANMRSSHSGRLTEFHERAAQYYEELLARDFTDNEGHTYSYGEWYFLEHPSWQERKREWLFHTIQLPSLKQRKAALLELTELFLDAFWWWGNYVHFDFCDQILADVGRLTEGRSKGEANSREAADASVRSWPKLRPLRQALADVLTYYPLRSVKSSGADWSRVENALLIIEDICGLSGVSDGSPARERHMSGLLNVFLAHTWRYRAVGVAQRAVAYGQAEAKYFKALNLVSSRDSKEDDPWSRAWICFELAEMRLSRTVAEASGKPITHSQVTGTMSQWQRAADIVQPPGESPDHELMSNLHRLLGDVEAWLDKGDPVEAARCYGRAVMHAYLFHIVGGPPDEYTLQFYVDVRARAINHLKTMWTAPPPRSEGAIECAITMWRCFRGPRADVEMPPTSEVLELQIADASTGTAAPLADTLFYPGPEVDQLGPENQYSEFSMAVLSFRSELLQAGVLSDLHKEDDRWRPSD